MVDLRRVPENWSLGEKGDSRKICEHVDPVTEKGVADKAMCEEYLGKFYVNYSSFNVIYPIPNQPVHSTYNLLNLCFKKKRGILSQNIPPSHKSNSDGIILYLCNHHDYV